MPSDGAITHEFSVWVLSDKGREEENRIVIIHCCRALNINTGNSLEGPKTLRVKINFVFTGFFRLFAFYLIMNLPH
jgi:hypothetical protein